MKQKGLYNTLGNINITKPFTLLSPANAHRGIKRTKKLVGFSAHDTKYEVLIVASRRDLTGLPGFSAQLIV